MCCTPSSTTWVRNSAAKTDAGAGLATGAIARGIRVQATEKINVIIGSDRSPLGPRAILATASHGEPQDRSNEGDKDDDENPQTLGDATNTEAIDQDGVDGRENHQCHSKGNQNNDQAGHSATSLGWLPSCSQPERFRIEL